MGWFSKKPDFTISSGGIDRVEVLKVGGVEQHILLQGEDQGNPILFFLHGGPSMPLPGVSSRGRDYTVATNTKELVKEYVVVFWDQRGTGRSYSDHIPPASMSLEQFVSEANEIIDYLRNHFGQERIYLAGHSFGSLIGMHLVQRYPHKFHSYVGLSQLISWTENDKLSYVWALKEAKRRNHKKALEELEAAGPPPYVKSFHEWGILRKWQTRFNSLIYTDEAIKHPGFMGLMKDMLLSKEYSLKDVYNTFYKGFKLVYTMDFIERLPHINVGESMKEIDVPVTFIHGRKDVHVHGSLLEDYYGGVAAHRGKKLIWMEKSAHLFHPDDTKRIEELLIQEKYTYTP